MKDNLVWHYTSIDTLAKICKTLKLRATHHAFLNDYTEIVHGAQMISNLINEYKSETHDCDSRVCTALKKIAQQLKKPDDMAKLKTIAEQIQKHIFDINLRGFYLISFSKVGDLLSQWRGYAPQNGCAIGLDKNILQNVFVNITPDVGDCIYLDAPTILMESLARIIADEGTSSSGLGLDNLVVVPKAIRQVYFTKNKGFEEEREFRLVFQRKAEEILFENGKPFIEVNIQKDVFHELIKEVIIAPNCSDQEKKYVEFLSRALAESYQKAELFKVTQSSLTFR